MYFFVCFIIKCYLKEHKICYGIHCWLLLSMQSIDLHETQMDFKGCDTLLHQHRNQILDALSVSIKYHSP